MTEQQIQTKKIKELEEQGYYVIKLKLTNKNGIPDLIAIPKDSDVKFVEVKKPNGKFWKLPCSIPYSRKNGFDNTMPES